MRRGFTLIELLVVICVIAILAGLLIPLISIALQKAREAKCDAKMANISSALSKYRDANGVYPDRINPSSTSFGTQPVGPAYESIFGTGTGVQTIADLKEGDWENVATNLVAQLATVDRENYRTMDESFRDPFGAGGGKSKVFRYRPARYYPLKYAATDTDPAHYPDNEDPPNPDSFQLWSAGANGKEEFGSGDDRPIWKKKK